MVFLLSLFLILSENVWLNNVCTCWRPSIPAGNIARLISSPYCRYTTPDKQQEWHNGYNCRSLYFGSIIYFITNTSGLHQVLPRGMPHRHVLLEMVPPFAGLSKIKFGVTCCLIFTPITHLLLCGWIVRTKDNFTLNIRSLSSISLNCYRSYRLHPLTTAMFNLSASLLHQILGASPYLRCLIVELPIIWHSWVSRT